MLRPIGMSVIFMMNESVNLWFAEYRRGPFYSLLSKSFFMRAQADTVGRITVGQRKQELETPVLVADLETMKSNLSEYIQIAEQNGVKLRSHAKAHKVPEIGVWQHRATGDGILCQTISEAEIMAAHGIEDIYLSYMVVEKSKLERAADLAAGLEFFATTVDGRDTVDPVQSIAEKTNTQMKVVLEVDLGLNRVGIEPGSPAVELAKYTQNQEYLDIVGVMGYEGHIGYGSNPARTVQEYRKRCGEAMDTLEETVIQIEEAGIDLEEVMVGSTATSKYSSEHPIVSEIHPGMYIFNDANLIQCMPTTEKSDCAATVVTTVISKPTEDRAIVDGGSKAFSLDLEQMPVPKHRDDIQYYNASEEHGWVDTNQSTEHISVGDRIEFIVPHVCTSVNLYDNIFGVKNGKIDRIWEVKGRGGLR